jgi:hypothetical protein
MDTQRERTAVEGNPAPNGTADILESPLKGPSRVGIKPDTQPTITVSLLFSPPGTATVHIP